MNNKPMLNAYPDSLGGKLSDIAALLKKKEMQDTFSSFYILPSLYHSDLDRGFSVVDYNLNEELATIEDLSQLKELGIDLKLDFILNHASAQSPQFKDLVEKGDESEYRDFFIDWNKFWEGHGQHRTRKNGSALRKFCAPVQLCGIALAFFCKIG